MQNNLKFFFFLAAQWLIYSEVMSKSAQTCFLVSRKSQDVNNAHSLEADWGLKDISSMMLQ